MKTYNLPDDLFTGPADENEVIIRHYTSGHDTIKNKIILNRNMINLLISGRKTVVYPEISVDVQEGELIILSTGNILTSEVIPNHQDFTSVLLYFSNDLLNRFWVKYEKLLADMPVNKNKHPFLIYKQDTFIRQYIGSLLLLLNSPGILTAEIKQVKLEELLLYILQLGRDKLQSLKVVSKDQADLQLKKAVETHIGLSITVAELAFLCNMSSSTFKRNFNRIYGTSPQQWLLEKKLLMASELLKSSTESPSRVYLKVGYKNHSSFSHAFRHHFALNPSEYQAQYLNALR